MPSPPLTPPPPSSSATRSLRLPARQVIADDGIAYESYDDDVAMAKKTDQPTADQKTGPTSAAKNDAAAKKAAPRQSTKAAIQEGLYYAFTGPHFSPRPPRPSADTHPRLGNNHECKQSCEPLTYNYTCMRPAAASIFVVLTMAVVDARTGSDTSARRMAPALVAFGPIGFGVRKHTSRSPCHTHVREDVP